ncbi:Type II toxin-antitoxin system RelE/ParE family toxin (plasmid) [Candidatus Trichorickettsia mobilis]|uniref:type II toxin-antitoxin system RelE/ParE family toxin n=1 Tax=Candidatus Trichorickettsia mobilis TaxID=1346319 RepID=UPI002B257279|nr:type II toxin-antitoxin system RelE/ParE family toxin [Candidatus Trichorickettsia mobilis]WPY01602.1 Type II toxin-antitoxin system RelE/ParE family toxin [Candidatus Trichorickettsia mobilis]
MQKIKEVKFFVSNNQKNHIASWLNKLDVKTRSRINLRLVRLEYGAYGDYKSLGDKLFELRFFFANGYRVYFTEHGNKVIILLCAGNKDSQNKDIVLARNLLEEFKSGVQNAKS